MSKFREAQHWLEESDLYPGAGLADAVWSSDHDYLVVRTRAFAIVLYRVSPAKVIWRGDPDFQAAGMEFMDDGSLLMRRFAPIAKCGAGTITIEVAMIDAGLPIRIVGPAEPCRTFGFSYTCRYQLIGRGPDASDTPGLLDLTPWDNVGPGDYSAEVMRVSTSHIDPDISFAWVSPDGTRSIIRNTTSGDSVEDHFCHLGKDADSYKLPNYRWAEPQYLWSPNGQRFAAVIREEIPSGWDEIPVGGPQLRSFVAAYDGQTGAQLWSKEVDCGFAPFEWTEGGNLEAANRIWNPVDGTIVPTPAEV